MKSMARPYPPKNAGNGNFRSFRCGLQKNQWLLLFSFGSDIPAGFYSLVLCDLSWDAMAPYTHAIVVNEGLHGRASQDFSMMVTVAPCTKRNDKKIS